MELNILPRLFLTAGIISLGLAVYWLVNRIILSQARSQVDGLAGAQRGLPTLLYFTTPTCAPCKTVQRPAIQRLREQMGDCIQVVEIDASTQPELASRWGVLSVPTTFIIDEMGQPRHVNHGVANTEKLLKQLESLS